jgi:serine/threonine-protein kinase
MPLSNEEFSHYKIVSPIGAGGMGEVYLAEDTRLGRNVALKFLPAEHAEDPLRLKRFTQEAKAASALNHQNILTIYEIGDHNGVRYIASEFVEGSTLRQRLETRRLLLDETLDISVQTLSAIAAAHEAGIIHRDIKPENIVIRSDGLVKVLDFGLAKLTQTSEQAASEGATRVMMQTTPGLVMGTVTYMSPEQARGKTVDARSDIFSFGVVLYEMLAGCQPYTGETPSDTMAAILQKDPPRISDCGVSVPAELEKIVTRSLEKDLERRYQTAGEMLDDVRSFRKRLEFEFELRRFSGSDKPTGITTKIFPGDTNEGRERANTIAVLPFLNMSRGEDGDYFSDGLAEELINVLSKIRGVRVAARTSTFSFKGKQTTIAEIGKALNVESVLEGSVRMAGDRVRISVQLVNVFDGFHLWSQTYDRTMDDIFLVQDDIAQSVVEELRTRFLGEDRGSQANRMIVSEIAEAVKGRADNAEAQRLMLLGRYFLDRTTREDTAKAIQYLSQAVDLDPEYALGWAELGRAYSIEAGRGWVPVKEGYDRVRDAIDRALQLEPDLAEGYAIRERIDDTYEWDFAAAEISMRRAMELAPGSSTVLDRASVLAYKLGRFEEALELSRRVSVQDPLSSPFWHNLGLTCHAAGRLTESENAFRKALELAPQRFVSGALLALVLMDEGRFADALAQAIREPDEFWKLWSLAIIYHAAGRDEDAKQALKNLLDKHAEGNAYQIAEIYSMHGDIDQAFEWLEHAVAERDPGVTHAKANPRFRAMHDDKRWADLLRKIGLDI